MFTTFLLSLREGLEAALIIGILLGALRKFGRPGLRATLWQGVLSAIVVSLGVALLLHRLGATLQDPVSGVFEGLTTLLAAVILTWMILWMSRQARHIKSSLENSLFQAARRDARMPVFLLAFVAVVREGVELALLLTAAAYSASGVQTLLGSVLGLGLAGVLGWGVMTTTIRLNLRRFFQVTGLLLLFVAAGLMAHGVHELNEVGWIPAIVEHVWNVNVVLDERSALGQIMSALFGYNGNPSLTEVGAYLAYWFAVALWAYSPSRVLPVRSTE